jgi:hypothetical protein
MQPAHADNWSLLILAHLLHGHWCADYFQVFQKYDVPLSNATRIVDLSWCACLEACETSLHTPLPVVVGVLIVNTRK